MPVKQLLWLFGNFLNKAALLILEKLRIVELRNDNNLTYILTHLEIE